MTASYDAWLIDLDGTLYRAAPLKLAMALELALFGLGSLATVRAFRHAHEQLREELAADASMSFEPSPLAEQMRRVAAATGRTTAQIEATIGSWMVERPARWLASFRRSSLVTEIRAHRAAGGRTAVVSDYPARRKLEALGLTDLFDTVVSNGEHTSLKRLKPAPDGMLLAASELGVTPERCLVIGDRDDADGAAARAAGMAFRLIK
jgi:beta-phosphoglucomutase-like phosphatase (HAD superfamily)